VKLESLVGADPGVAGGQRALDDPLEQVHTAVESASEALLFGPYPAVDLLAPGCHPGMCLAHDLDRALGEAA